MVLKLAEGMEARFQVIDTDAFGDSFTMYLHGAGRRGWFQALRRMPGHDADTGLLPLGKGEWRIFLNLIRQSRFWELPEQFPDPPSTVVADGEFLDLAGRDGERYHRIHRFVWREPVLDQVLLFCRRRSGLFVQLPGFWAQNVPPWHAPDPAASETSA